MAATVVKSEVPLQVVDETECKKFYNRSQDSPRSMDGDGSGDVSDRNDNDLSDKDDYDKSSSPYSPQMNGDIYEMDFLRRHNFSKTDNTSQLIREMIHSREKRMQAMQIARDSLQNGDDILSKGMYRNGELNLDMSLVGNSLPDSDASATDESDLETDKNQNSKLCQSAQDAQSPPLSPGDNDTGSEPVSLKRARVENIVSGMRLSPSSQPKSDNLSTPQSEVRRQKRKQYLPQQHDVRLNDEPVYKQPRIEKDNLKEQLKQMQQQLVDMQQKYLQLFEKGERPEDIDMVDGDTGSLPFKASQRIVDIPKDKHDSKSDQEKKKLSSVLNMDDNEMEPSKFIDHVCKLVKEQESVNKSTSECLDRQSSPVIRDLAKALKAEIQDVISSTVDTVVTKFISDNKNKLNIPTPQPRADSPPSKPVRDQPRASTPKTESHKPVRPKVSDKHPFRLPDLMSNGFPEPAFHPIPTAHHPFHGLPFFAPHMTHHQPFLTKKESIEQTEALSLVMNTPKKKRTKVTDTRLSPRAARALLHDSPGQGHEMDKPLHHLHPHHPDAYSPLVPVSLPTSVAIPNPSLQHSDILSMYSHVDHLSAFHESQAHQMTHSPPMDHSSPNGHQTPPDSIPFSMVRSLQDHHHMQHDRSRSDTPTYEASLQHMTTTLTPMHLRKAKLMFFFTRYPSSAIIKVYFPDIKFNKNNTAQLVKWFSNFREFYYIQMEKYARQAIAEGVKNSEEITVSADSELYRILNLHYNRNNQIEVPENFRLVTESTLREFYKALIAGKDTEQSWKKAIYKVISRLDDSIPEFFKSANWMEQLGDQ